MKYLHLPILYMNTWTKKLLLCIMQCIISYSIYYKHIAIIPYFTTHCSQVIIKKYKYVMCVIIACVQNKRVKRRGPWLQERWKSSALWRRMGSVYLPTYNRHRCSSNRNRLREWVYSGQQYWSRGPIIK